ncbi:MAG TPA: SDR family oxidoreductase [Bryobacteraceae bacterium]|nr:SDR family oxidoreductase [Bryobacteraceae bacterium]
MQPYPGEMGSESVFFEFDEIQVGRTAELTHLLTEQDLQAFAELTGDFNPLHFDPVFARSMHFPKAPVHGMLSAVFVSTLIGMLLPGKGALWTSQTIQFLQPAYIGDTLRVWARVKQRSPALRMLVLTVEITNQQNQKLISGEASVKMTGMKQAESQEPNGSQVVLITGGGGVIGSAIARQLAADGHAVALTSYKNSQSAEEVAAEIVALGGRAISLQVDIREQAAVEAAVSRMEEMLGPVEAVVHCAAPSPSFGPFADLDWAALQSQLDVQVKGAFHCAQAVLPRMVEASAGSLLFVGSTVSDGQPPALQCAYVVAKTALTALARCLAVEYGPKGIRVNVVAPGMTLGGISDHLPEKAKMVARMQTPLRRLAEPADIAGVASFLLSSRARHVTGETLRVSGGTVMS